MKLTCRSASNVAVVLALASSGADTTAVFGPAGCVSLSRSTVGTCVIDTNCEGQDLSKVEFGFSCKVPHSGRFVPHSFGRGGFDASETFDTDIKCKQCLPLMPHKLNNSPANKAALATVQLTKRGGSARARARVQAKVELPAVQMAIARADPNGVTSYGPNSCVSTHMSQEGRCIMQTKCQEDDIKSYQFGLICEDSHGAKVRHLFGQDSFGANETFDTLLRCTKCLALDEKLGTNPTANRTTPAVEGNGSSNVSGLVEEVAALTEEVLELKTIMTNVTGDVSKLNTAVFTTPAPETSTEPGSLSLVLQRAVGGSQTRMVQKLPHLHHNLRRHAGQNSLAALEEQEQDNVAQSSHDRASSKLHSGHLRTMPRRQMMESDTENAAAASDGSTVYDVDDNQDGEADNSAPLEQVEGDDESQQATAQHESSDEQVAPGDTHHAAGGSAEDSAEVVDVSQPERAEADNANAIDNSPQVSTNDDGSESD